MKLELVLVGLASLVECGAVNVLHPRQTSSVGSDQSYLLSVCSPNVTSSSGTLPPCISVVNIQTQCEPNGTDALDYIAMQECLCNAPSTFFSDWLGCRQCLEYHGGLSENDLARYTTVINSVSNAICTGTPAGDFASYFSSINDGVAAATTGATSESDQAPSQTAVSLYYTVSSSQGPGLITGSATSATGTGGAAAATTTASNGAASSENSAATSGATAASSTASSSSQSTSSSGAAPTVAYGFGLALAAVGGAAVLL